MDAGAAQDESIRMFERSRSPAVPEPTSETAEPRTREDADVPQAIADIMTGIASAVSFLAR